MTTQKKTVSPQVALHFHMSYHIDTTNLPQTVRSAVNGIKELNDVMVRDLSKKVERFCQNNVGDHPLYTVSCHATLTGITLLVVSSTQNEKIEYTRDKVYAKANKLMERFAATWATEVALMIGQSYCNVNRNIFPEIY